ncbi:response regulator transcription factor [Bacillus norwichensis]|uniref:Response regulator transcription factor n=1 Tax=Bacillus norwichensis TaxID=2762217 RepID=A0ABR8VHG5_9BACI|nr:response regulator transcription factor [Bacillus norwichensis]MBD8004212.1 response regulator transcription factor [Bacillus norwichensis]
MTTILIVEDEYPINQVLKVYLRKAGFQTESVASGTDALKQFEVVKPTLVLLDVMLPGLSGWEVLQEIRRKSDCPVIMLTALGEVNYRLDGLNKGADDYISKPFVGEEVVARVKAVLRRSEKKEPSIKQYGGLEIDFQGHRVILNGEEVHLTPRDLSLLLFLAEHPNQTFTRDQLIEKIWGWDYEGSDRAVDLSIKRLRKSLKGWPAKDGKIRTLRGLGYQLSVQHE